ncbi:hypothetical protein [Galbibacter pacificus]|uniref:DUF4136 domain-containing protein n=1 Tax=Galbibacter pacificus TaxID=2996052 RepID=A0ABT6FVI9_9FLAO|nr:hypothetical protein [Galbibacter pacificus]MDG3583803.1 hypothetical protein [Galbibacter pacificus]MDG3587279.1 hypothetical protein [Galbibacter pacificus]
MNKRIIASLIVLCLIYACGTTTKITASWANKEAFATKKYKSVFIAAITSNVPAKTVIEDELAFQMQERSIKPTKSHDVFPGTFTKDNKPSKETLLKGIKDSGSEAILTVTLRDEETESRYVPGTTNYAMYSPLGYGYYGNFYGYYNSVYGFGYDPGYYTTDKVYYLETNIYDASSEELIWSAQSKTYNPTDIDNFTKGYTEAIIGKLQDDGILAK